jgi:hypothetical protein
MTRRVRRWKLWAGLAVVLGATSASTIAQNQGLVSQLTEKHETRASELSYSMYPATDEVIARVLKRNRLQSEALRSYSAMRTYELKNSEGKLAARAVVRVTYKAPDRKTFDKTSEQGSAIVRHLVFDRLMRSENETASGHEHHDSAITTANYTFALAGAEDIGQYHCLVLEARPKRRDKYLFEGKIWVDAQDFAIVQIAGHPARKPSFWVNRADFVRQYQKIGGFWLPYRDEASVEVKLYGRKIFTVDYQRYSIDSSNSLQTRYGDRNQPDSSITTTQSGKLMQGGWQKKALEIR